MSARHWCWTLNNPTVEEELAIEGLKYRYIIYGHETGDEGTHHLQGYAEFDCVMRLAGVKKLITRAHWEQRRSTREKARDYCKKQGEWLEYGDWAAGGRGARNDLRGAMELVKERVPWIQMAEQMPEVVARNDRFLTKYLAHVEEQQSQAFRKVEVHVYEGAAGTGKTRKVKEQYPESFTVNAGEAFPFEGYNGQDVILLDDFYGGIPYHQLLRVLDGHQYRVNVKGSHRYAMWTKVFITSNDKPELWYSKGMTPALRRRLTTVTNFVGNDEGGNTMGDSLVDISDADFKDILAVIGEI